jgi:UDP-N-acetylmuramate dehydrogenase
MGITIQEHEPLAPHTSMGVGGSARYWSSSSTLDQLRASIEWAKGRTLAVQILGGGSNTIFADGTYPGLVIKVDLMGIEQIGDDDVDGVTLKVAAGEDWDDFVVHSIGADLSGIECLSGIPGLVGATPIQNVGAYGQEVAQTITEVTALDRDSLEEVTFSGEECGFSYRSSRFKTDDRDRFLITNVCFRLSRGIKPALNYPQLRERMEASGDVTPASVREVVLALRRAKSMVLDPQDPNARSAGSYFLNPIIHGPPMDAVEERWHAVGDRSCEIPKFPESGGRVKIPAAWLVENSGFGKGFRYGQAGISENHALAIVAHGERAADVVRLGEMIQEAVEKRFGIRLEREPALVE